MNENLINRNGSDALVSIVVPVYNEESTCPIFLNHIQPILEGVTSNYEIIFIDDGSRDGTVPYLTEANAKDPRVKLISLSRNFGKELALTAGIDVATGDAVIPIDVDLQDPPALIPEMIRLWQEGHDVVLPVRANRKSDSFMKRATADLFYKLIGKLSDVEIPENVGDFRLIDRRVVDALKRMPERTRFMKGLFAWLGYNPVKIVYTRNERSTGETKWAFWGLWNLALEGIISFSTLPLRIWTYFGTIIAFLSVIWAGYIVIGKILFGNDVQGYPSLIVAILFFSGVNMIGLGVLGEYLGRIFIEVKRRPRYLIMESLGIDKDLIKKNDETN